MSVIQFPAAVGKCTTHLMISLGFASVCDELRPVAIHLYSHTLLDIELVGSD